MKNHKNIPNEEIIREIIVKTIKKYLKETNYYHGTSAKNASGISKNGLNASNAVELIGGSKDGEFASAKGRNYITNSPANALRYGLMSDGDDDVHIFDFEEDEYDEKFGFDEDELGYVTFLYLNKRIPFLPFNTKYLNFLTKNEIEGIKRGEFKYFTATKKFLDKITTEEKNKLLSLKDEKGNNIIKNLTSTSNLKPTGHYTVKRPSKDEYSEMMNFKKYGNEGIIDNLKNYYLKNRRKV